MPQWLIPLLALLGGGIGVYVAMRIALVELKGETRAMSLLIAKIEQWQKDKEHFDYLFRHDEYNNDITGINAQLLPMIQQVKALEKDVQDLRDWKHDVVDAYVPRAIEEHERRINRLDVRVFNGGSK